MPDLGNNSVFSQTDASNNSGTMPSWSGSAAPSTIDDAGRAFQGAVTREWNWRNYTLTAGGTANVKTLTYTVAPAAYYNGQRFAFKANTTNTGSVTLNVNALGAKTIKKIVNGTATNLAAGDMVSGAFVEVTYNTAGGYFVWTNFDFSTALTFSSGAVSIGGAPFGGLLNVGDTTNYISLDGYSGTAYLTLGKLGTGNNLQIRFDSAENKATIAGGVYPASADLITLSTSGVLSISPTAGIGYGTGAGSTQTQATSKTTSVTINAPCGQITTAADSLASGASAAFTVNNSFVSGVDTIIAHSQNVNYSIRVNQSAAGSFVLTIKNEGAITLSQAVVINFTVIKSVIA